MRALIMYLFLLLFITILSFECQNYSIQRHTYHVYYIYSYSVFCFFFLIDWTSETGSYSITRKIFHVLSYACVPVFSPLNLSSHLMGLLLLKFLYFNKKGRTYIKLIHHRLNCENFVLWILLFFVLRSRNHESVFTGLSPVWRIKAPLCLQTS